MAEYTHGTVESASNYRVSNPLSLIFPFVLSPLPHSCPPNYIPNNSLPIILPLALLPLRLIVFPPIL